MSDPESQIMLRVNERAPRTTSQSLAPELVGRILELGVESLVLEHVERYSLLCSASRVCMIWSLEARVLLWKNVIVQQAQAVKLLSSPALGRYQTRELSLRVVSVVSSLGRLTPRSATAVAASLVGIRSLHLARFIGVNRLEQAVLYLPSLKVHRSHFTPPNLSRHP